MQRTLVQLVILPLLVTFIFVSTLTPIAKAAVIDTQTILQVQTEAPQQKVQAFLAREEVRDQLVAFGVDPESASLRVASLSEQEVALLQHHINDLPAGADALAVIGVVFLVLLILELVGVTNVFSKI